MWQQFKEHFRERLRLRLHDLLKLPTHPEEFTVACPYCQMEYVNLPIAKDIKHSTIKCARCGVHFDVIPHLGWVTKVRHRITK